MAGKLRFFPAPVIRHVPMAGLVVLCALSLGFAWQAIFGPILPKSGEDGSTARASVAPPELAGRDLFERAMFQPGALITKPLFSPTRAQPSLPPPIAPVPEAVASPPAPEEPPPNYIVQGIVATPSVRKALLRKDDSTQSWLTEGRSSSEGWVLSNVTPEMVTLSKGSRTFSLQLQPKRFAKPQIATR